MRGPYPGELVLRSLGPSGGACQERNQNECKFLHFPILFHHLAAVASCAQGNPEFGRSVPFR
jgi:hypothetical protein